MTRRDQIKEIARIQRLKGEKQWRAAREFALDVNPQLAKENEIHMSELATLREQLAETNGVGKHLRFTVSIPVTIMEVIRKFDPDFMLWDKHAYKTKSGSNKESRRLMRAFPEYTIPVE